MPFFYVNPTSGPGAGGIGWFNFNSFATINPGQTIAGLTGTLNDGTTVTFDLITANVSGVAPVPLTPLQLHVVTRNLNNEVICIFEQIQKSVGNILLNSALQREPWQPSSISP